VIIKFDYLNLIIKNKEDITSNMPKLPSQKLVAVYKTILKLTEKRVQHYSPHLNLAHFNIPQNIKEDKLLENLSDLSNYIEHPYYAHIYIKNK